MKKFMLSVITLAMLAAAPTAAYAQATVQAPAPAQTAAPAAKDPATVMVTVNGVKMTQAQARLVILQNIKNHKQMTPEEMTAYVNSLEAAAEAETASPAK